MMPDGEDFMGKRLISLLVLLVLGCACGSAQSRKTPNLDFQDLDGNKHRLADPRGSIAVVNFWATWCGPCREELPMLSRLTQQYASRNVRFISISADEDPSSRKQRDKINKFLNDQKPAMEIWVGADLDALERCGLGQLLPATMILDSNGQIVSRIEGQAHEEDITQPVDWLLNGKVGTPPAAIVKRY
jgi:thiol-disulfide isomerase/thioredoxin